MYYTHAVWFQRILRCAYKVTLFNNVQKAIVSSRTKELYKLHRIMKREVMKQVLLILPQSIERIFTQFRSKCNVFDILLIT